MQGGQILRMAVSLSALTNKPIKVIKIRAGRLKGGLAAQHLKGNPFDWSHENGIIIHLLLVIKVLNWSKTCARDVL